MAHYPGRYPGYPGPPYSQSGQYIWPQSNVSGGYNPYGNTPYPPGPSVSFGQSLFQAQSTPANYTYDHPYTNLTPSSAHAVPLPPVPLPGYNYPAVNLPPPPKRQRVDNGPSDGGFGAGSWRNCSQPGCKFVGSGKDVEIHEEDRHLIYRPGKQPQRSEEEERFAKRKGPAPTIEGTNITLQTPEDIEKWIAERKAKWPSAKRIAEKDAERKAAIERGELPDRGGKRGRGRGGMFGGRAQDPAAQAEDWGRTPVERTERQLNDRGRGRGKTGGARGGRGRGGRQGESDRTQDGGWSQRPSQKDEDESVKAAKMDADVQDVVLQGINDYESSNATSDSESSTTSSSSSSDSSSESDSESEQDLEETQKNNVNVVNPARGEPSRPVCKFFAKSGRCNRGDRCNFAHTNAPSAERAAPQAPVEKKKQPRQPPAKRSNPFERPSMLGALLAVPIQNTLSQLSQTIRFLVANDMLENVELTPGQAEDVEREKNKVVELDAHESEAVEALQAGSEPVHEVI